MCWCLDFTEKLLKFPTPEPEGQHGCQDSEVKDEGSADFFRAWQISGAEVKSS